MWEQDHDLARRFGHAENADILELLQRHGDLYAHSDVDEMLAKAADPIPDCANWSPNPKQYSYSFLYAPTGVICGLAHGMRSLCLRVPPKSRSAAIAAGAKSRSDLGVDWVEFNPFRIDRTQAEILADLEHWCMLAFDYANLSPSPNAPEPNAS